MSEKSELESLYREAQSALKSRDYIRASELLRQILVIDENYKDVSRLLAQMVKLKRRRWHNDPRLFGKVGVVAIIALGVVLAPKVSSLLTGPEPVKPTVIIQSTDTVPPTDSPIPTETVAPTPTSIPLAWKRINIGQDFERDTITAFAADKKDPDVIYAGMKNAGVYKTIDSGLSWRPAHTGLLNTQVESLLIDSQNPQVLYAGTMGGVFKAEDGGENWHRIGEGTYLLMDYQDNSHLYARDENGIYETTDQGNTWSTVYALRQDCPDAISSWAIHPADGKMLFIGGGETCAGIYQSSDNGRNWALIGLEDKPDLNPLAIGLDEQGNFSIYTNFAPTTGRSVEERGIYFSHNGGATWSLTQVGGSVDGTCNILASDPDNPTAIYCAGSSRLSTIQKKGEQWEYIPNTETKIHTAFHIDHPNGTERIIVGGTNINNHDERKVGIFISTDNGLSWNEKNNGIGSTRSELKIDPMNNARIYLATNYYSRIWYQVKNGCTLYRSMDNGKSWPSIKTADWCGPSFDVVNSFYLKETDMLQKLQGDGENWLWNYCTVDNKGSGNWQSEAQVKCDAYNTRTLMGFALPVGSQSVSANPYMENLIYAVGNNIYYSTTGSSSSWQLSTGSEDLSDARLFYANQGKIIYAIDRVHPKYSTDNGMTWQSCGTDVTTSRSDSRLALDLQGKRLYLATPGQGVLVSTDQCQSWQPSNNGLTNLFVNTLAIDPNNLNTIYAGTDGGAYVSFDGGATWGQVNDGLLGATVVYSIAVDKDSNVYAATPYGVFKLEDK